MYALTTATRNNQVIAAGFVGTKVAELAVLDRPLAESDLPVRAEVRRLEGREGECLFLRYRCLSMSRGCRTGRRTVSCSATAVRADRGIVNAHGDGAVPYIEPQGVEYK